MDHRPMTAVRCDSCERLVARVRGSMWHGRHRICIACFFVWYDDAITSPGILGAEIVYRETIGAWPFPSDEPGIARVTP